MNKKFFIVSVIFNIIFMGYVLVYSFSDDSSSPAVLFFLLMPTLYFAHAYYDLTISKVTQVIIVITNLSLFSLITATTIFVISRGNPTLGEFAMNIEETVVLIYLAITLLILVYGILIFSLFFVTFNIHLDITKQLYLASFIIIVASMYIGKVTTFFDIFFVFALVIIQAINTYFLINEYKF